MECAEVEACAAAADAEDNRTIFVFMRYLTLCLLIFFTPAFGQGEKKIQPTDAISLTGLVEKEAAIGISEISSLPSRSLPDVVITNHRGEPRGTAKGLRGVLVKDLLAGVTFKAESPKVLSEFYLTFVASDGYTVVYSWNELFNSPNGDNCFLITEKDGKKLAEMPERMLVITPTDFKTGRRHIKGLSKILVGRAGR